LQNFFLKDPNKQQYLHTPCVTTFAMCSMGVGTYARFELAFSFIHWTLQLENHRRCWYGYTV